MDSTRHFPGRVLSFFPLKSLPGRDRMFIPLCILLITVLAWAYLVHLDRQMSADLDYEKAMAAMGMSGSQGWTLVDALLAFAMWTVMMIGMMTPAAAPVILLFASMQSERIGRGTSLEILLFALGYAAIWSGFSAVAAGFQLALHEAAQLSTSMAVTGGYWSGAILIAVGLYQWSSLKSMCLTHCRSPLGFLMTNWRAGKLGAFQMGWRHGVYCLGCCWALMVVLFAVGVMNLVWVALLSGIVLLEKIGPRSATIAKVVGVGLVVFGVATIAHLVR